MPKDVFKETRTPLVNEKESKSIFTIEKKADTFTFDSNHPFHYHNWYELYCIKKGHCTYYIGKNKYTVGEGEWVFIPPGVNHKVVYHTSLHERYLMYFSKDYLPFSLGPEISKFFSYPVYTPAIATTRQTDEILIKLLGEFQNADEYSEALYKSYLLELFVQFIRNPMEKSSQGDEKDIKDIFIAHILEYIGYNYFRNISLSEIAMENDISVSYLSRRFKKVTGLNISEYIRMIRINHAKKLLLETDESILEISEKCGFNDSNYFSCVFKEQEAISPLNYRKIHSEKLE